MVISLGPGTDEDRRMMRFCLDLTRPPLWNKLIDKFLDLYTLAEQRNQEGRAENMIRVGECDDLMERLWVAHDLLDISP